MITRKLRPAVEARAARDYDVVLNPWDEVFSQAGLFAAGLDVFRTEPGGNPEIAALPNVFLLPHIGSATEESRDAMRWASGRWTTSMRSSPGASRATVWPDLYQRFDAPGDGQGRDCLTCLAC